VQPLQRGVGIRPPAIPANGSRLDEFCPHRKPEPRRPAALADLFGCRALGDASRQPVLRTQRSGRTRAEIDRDIVSNFDGLITAQASCLRYDFDSVLHENFDGVLSVGHHRPAIGLDPLPMKRRLNQSSLLQPRRSFIDHQTIPKYSAIESNRLSLDEVLVVRHQDVLHQLRMG
jgi:hypothetical protein